MAALIAAIGVGRRGVVAFAAALTIFFSPPEARACSLVGTWIPEVLSTPQAVVARAQWIIRARAVGYARPPAKSELITTGEPDSVVRFEVLERVKGAWPAEVVELPGYLSTRDDFDPLPVPYEAIRPGGRRGSCIANSYRKDAEFLLMLRRHRGGAICGRGFFVLLTRRADAWSVADVERAW